MEQVTTSIEINGRLEPVFDLVTTTRYWPQWHPATVEVDGVTERPFTLNDQIIERAQIGPRLYEGTWTVVEWERPFRVVLRGESGRIFISYAFEQTGEQVKFGRQLQYHPEDFAASAPDSAQLKTIMHQQSQLALQKLKELVEGLMENGR